MDEALRTVLISLGTSLVVSLVTFVLGLKSGKNQADRTKLQELYKQLYRHFADLEKSIKENRCKIWENYEHIQRGMITTYIPPARKLEMSGDLIFLKSRIAETAVSLEKKVMEFGSKQDRAAKSIHTVLLDNLALLSEGYTFEEYAENRGQKNRIKTANPKDCKRYKNYSYRDIYDKAVFDKILKDLEDDETYAVTFASKGNPPEYSFCIFPGGLAVSASEYSSKLEKCFREQVDGYADAEAEKSLLLKEIVRLKRQLKKRAKEPFTFWETFFGAFADLFR